MDATGAFGVADEAEVGIFGFVSADFEPLGGVLKTEPEDFVVCERRLDGALVRPPLCRRRRRKASVPSQVEDNADAESNDEWPQVLLSKSKAAAVANEEYEFDERKREVAEPSEFLRFTMWKRCADTLEAIGSISSALQLPIGKLGFAGIKDSRAVTCQEVTVPRRIIRSDDASEIAITPALLVEAAAKSGRHIRVGGFVASDCYLFPGRLIGNRFKIKIRGVKARSSPMALEAAALASKTSLLLKECTPWSACSFSKSEDEQDLCMNLALEHAIGSVRSRGFVNYIGMQRFGKAGVRSDLVGRAYLQQDYEQCISLILLGPPDGNAVSSSADTQHRNSAARQKRWRNRMPRWAELFQRTWSADSALNAMNDHSRAKLWVEHRLLQLIRRFQQRPNTGEEVEQLAWPELCKQAFLRLPRNIRSLYVFAYFDRLWNLCASERIALSPQAPIEGDLVWEDREKKTVRHLGADELQNHSIFDVVLPRAGTEVKTPRNVIGELFAQYLHYDGLDMEELAMEMLSSSSSAGKPSTAAAAQADTADDCLETEQERNEDAADEAVPDDAESGGWFSIVGDYRELLCRPQRVRWSFEREPPPPFYAKNGVTDELPGLLYSVLLKFDLPRGAYATMLFRELCRRRGSLRGRGGNLGAGRGRSHVVWKDSDEEADDVERPHLDNHKDVHAEKTVSVPQDGRIIDAPEAKRFKRTDAQSPKGLNVT